MQTKYIKTLTCFYIYQNFYISLILLLISCLKIYFQMYLVKNNSILKADLIKFTSNFSNLVCF